MKSGSISQICERNPACKRARYQFASRFKALRNNRNKDQPNDLTVQYLISIWTGQCDRADCGKTLNPVGVGRHDDRASLDRIIPAKGYVKGNVRWLCGRCNRQKQDMTSVEMLAMLADQLEAENEDEELPETARAAIGILLKVARRPDDVREAREIVALI